MTTLQKTALALTAIWLVMVIVRFRRSTIVLIGGLVAIGSCALVGVADGEITPGEIGLGAANWWRTIGFAVTWLGLMLSYSPVGDWLASRWFAKPPTLKAFRAIQESRSQLIVGIVVAWVLGGFLEELVFRGIVLKSVHSWLNAWAIGPIAAAIAVCIAAFGAGLIHLYQGPRATVIVTQLSVLFGVLFVVSGYNLWAVVLCHGLYDTVAFVRFANRKSKYSNLDREAPASPETRA